MYIIRTHTLYTRCLLQFVYVHLNSESVTPYRITLNNIIYNTHCINNNNNNDNNNTYNDCILTYPRRDFRRRNFLRHRI